jgi:hypothetical protein
MRMQTAQALVEFTAEQIRLHYGPGPHADGTPQSVHGGGTVTRPSPKGINGVQRRREQGGKWYTPQPKTTGKGVERTVGREGNFDTTHSSSTRYYDDVSREAEAAEQEGNRARLEVAAAHQRIATVARKGRRVPGEWKSDKNAPDTWNYTEPDGTLHSLQVKRTKEGEHRRSAQNAPSEGLDDAGDDSRVTDLGHQSVQER